MVNVSEQFLIRLKLHELPAYRIAQRAGVNPNTLSRLLDEQGRITDCRVGQVGYAETSKTLELPSAGNEPPIARRDVSRPGLGPTGIRSDMYEQWVPGDIEDLWRTFVGLPAPKRDQFLRAGNAYLNAKSMWPDQRTAYAVFLVVACEALKPRGKRYNRANVYDVVASLTTPSEGERLRALSVPPQRVRSKHVHRGELAADELLPILIHNPFKDPSFDEMIDELSRVSQVCLIEWLRCRGDYKLVLLPRGRRTLAARVRATAAAVWRWIRRIPLPRIPVL